MATFSPEAFGKYFLVDKIATGGMAEIFKAKTYSHGGFENLLVIKRILAHLGENEEFVSMFVDEAKLSVALQHPNIIRVYDFGKLLDNYFIAMECVEGKDVRNLLRQLGRKQMFLPVEFCAYVAHEAAKGLDFAHRKLDAQGRPYGIVHRDISPSNILVSYDGEVKIADFGIAKAASNVYETRDGVLKGKFEYMSPEQATGQELDRRSDVFSIGIILYEMLTGRRLFKEDNEILTLERIRRIEVDPPSDVNPRVPKGLDKIVMKALSARDARYQWAHELQEDLQEFFFPQTADTLREGLSRFMKELFDDEIADEQSRLARASSVAERLRARAENEGWESPTESTIQREPKRAIWPFVLLGALVMFVPMAAGTALLAALLASRVELAEVATTGSVDVVVLPAARVSLDGTLLGEAESITLEEVAPGAHVVRLEADGYVPLEEQVMVVAGQSARLVRTLAPVAPEAEPDPPPRGQGTPSAAPPTVAFASTPSGAEVRVDGRSIGRTPVTWSGGRPDTRYAVELRLDGYEPATASVSGLTPGKRTGLELSLKPSATDPGSLTVALIGGGWANVWVDGQKLAKPAPLSGQAIAPGRHTIRVENPTIGLDYTETVTVASGQAVTVRAKAE